MSTHTVTDNPAASRFEMSVDGQLCVLDYRRTGNVLNLIHAEVPYALNGRGLGSHLVTGALDIIERRQEKMIPTCSFVAAHVRRHARYQALVAD